MGSGGSRVDDSQRKNVSEDFLKIIHVEATLFYWIILVISITAIAGNLFVIKAVLVRKYKYLQKICMISLAASDILTVVTFCINYMDLLGKPLNLIWSLGEFLCWYNPVGQVLGNLTSSLALLVIALDRYHNIIYALNKKWNPDLWKCITLAVILWGICLGISYPMSTFYFHIPLRIPNGQDVYMCTGTSTTRGKIGFYYVFVNILFFLPLITMFFWLYYKIAVLVWKHRKPIYSKSATREEQFENSLSSKGNSDASSGFFVKKYVKRKNIQMERKVRTFKIVIILIFAFILCRMPYWLFWVIKLLISFRSGNGVWRATLIFTTLNILNCALNPFLYTFLNQTIHAYRKVTNLVCTTCCCCFSNAEFDDYERGAPIDEGLMGKIATVEQPRSQELYPYQNHDSFPQVPRFPKYTSINRF